MSDLLWTTNGVGLQEPPKLPVKMHLVCFSAFQCCTVERDWYVGAIVSQGNL